MELIRSMLTREGFEKLLATLDSDPARAGEQYERLRGKLVRFFEWHQATAAEDMADEVFDRVGRRLAEGEVIRAADPASYFFGVARNMLHEHWDARKREQRVLREVSTGRSASAEAAEGSDETQEARDCLQRCLKGLTAERRHLIVAYYRGEGGVKIRARQRLAESLQLAPGVLRLRAFRIRETLERCVRACLQSRGSGPGPGIDRNESGLGPTPSVQRGSR
jgi:DNA-directed RNA polymerase specialized sigma24 family protein